MEFAEKVAKDIMKGWNPKCPFKKEGPPVPKVQKEHVKRDDSRAAQRVQANSGGVLGGNLAESSPTADGAANTVNNIAKPPKHKPVPRNDSKSDPTKTVTVEQKEYPFKVAAHHLIPGEAALARSVVLDFMTKGKKVTSTAGKSYKVKEHIGYNVNGAHNGAWLPGNYAIRKKTSPAKGKSWSVIVEDDNWKNWCYKYMQACVRKANGQFHDAHVEYSEAVLEVLDKISQRLTAHQDTNCKDCKNLKEIYPPYHVKTRLYNFSKKLRTKVRTQPTKWRFPWCTSDRFKAEMAKRGSIPTGYNW